MKTRGIALKKLLILNAPHFYASAECSDGLVVETAPILKYMMGWNVERVRDYGKKKGWKIMVKELET